MTLNFFRRRSLKNKVTLFTLVIFLLSLWSLAFYASRMLREDMQRLLGEQQFSMASVAAAEINGELQLRLRSLQTVAERIAPEVPDHTAALQTALQDQAVLQSLFNGGLIAYRGDGTAIADTAPAAGRIGANYADDASIAAALQKDTPTIGWPVLGKRSGVAEISLSVPIHDGHGTVIGALAGVLQLGQPNFLDEITKNHYGKSGSFLVLAPRQRMMVTASDKTRIMEALPAAGTHPAIDRFVQGYEGSQVFVNSKGVEVLASVKGIPLAGWAVASQLPTAEAFVPIVNLQRRMLLTTLLLTLLAGGLTRWMLKRQLAPLFSTVKTLATLSQLQTPPPPLPVTRHDEIGHLIGGFNTLLKTLAQRETLLKQILDTSSVAIFVVDMQGRITQANQRMAEMFGCTVDTLVGGEYVALVHPSERDTGRQQMLALLASEIPSVDLHRLYWRHDQTEFWGHLTGQRFVDADGAERGLVGVIADVTGRIQAEKYEQFRSHTLEFLAAGDPLPSVLEAIVRGVEQLKPTMLCSVLLLDRDGKHLGQAIAPSLPAFYNAAIDGLEIGPGVGSCGTAAFTGERVIVEDIANHPYWAPYQELAARAGLAACWSQPIRAASGQVLGTFAIYHHKPHTPVASDIALIEQVAHLASIAIERSAAAQAIRDSEERFRSVMENISSVAVQGYTPDGTVTFWNRASELLYGYSAAQALGHNLHALIIPAGMRDEVRAAMRQMYETGVPIPSGEMQLQTRDGALVSVITSHALVNHAGQQTELFCVDVDLTERKRVEQALQESEHRYRTMIEWTPEAIGVHRNGKVVYVNPAAIRMFGAQSAQEMIGKPIMDLVHPDSRAFALARAQVVANNGLSVPLVEEKYLRMDGSAIDVEVQATRIVFDGKDANLIAVRDVTERKRAQEKLQLAAKVFSHAREAIMITSASGDIIDVNEAFSRITGYSREEVLGQNPRLLSSGRQGKEYYAAMWRGLAAQGHWYGEVWNRRKNGEVYAEMQTISAVRGAQGEVQQYVALFSDITATKEHQQQLEHIAHFDALTGLPNRVLLADRLHQAMAQTQRRGQQTAVAFLDLDGFKAINDTHGHDAGDQLLIALATRMKQALREGDTLARMGGDEFVAVLVDLTDLASCVPLLNRLLTAAALPVQIGNVALQVSASLGVTFYPQAEIVDADQLLRQADQAMYQAKLAGKNRYHVFDAEQDRSVRGHHESLDRIRHALAQAEFVLHYQPKVNMRTGVVIGAEALIRWQHPEQGLLAPAQFLPVIEDHPLAIEVGEWVIDTALTQVERWRAAGLDLPVSVNVGARQLQQADFVQRLRAILAAHPQVPSTSLELEVLETSALDDMAGVSKVIETCRGMGVLFALDDFGTGYSSLTYLKRLPASLLKIDQSFVRDMLDDPDDLAILDGVIGLAAAFRREVIAEGVETVAHGQMLLQLGCELGQGYGIARPMPAEALPDWARSWKPDASWSQVPLMRRDDLPLLFASVEHHAWVKAIESHLRGERDTPPELDPAQCHFGGWLAKKGMALHGAHASFAMVDTLHQHIHTLGSELCHLYAQGQGAQALERVGELQTLVQALLEQLHPWTHRQMPKQRRKIPE